MRLDATEQRFALEALLRSRRAREAAGDLAISYIAFDLLAAPDDLRELPLHRRWGLLTAALAEAGPPLETVMATTDRTLALEWFGVLAPLGIQGLVYRGLATRYRPEDRCAWVKLRHADTVDVRLLGITGSVRRPWAALLELPDGQRATTPKLNALHALEIADALATNPSSWLELAGSGDMLMLPVPLAAEARLGSSRQIQHLPVGTVRVSPSQIIDPPRRRANDPRPPHSWNPTSALTKTPSTRTGRGPRPDAPPLRRRGRRRFR